jgi:hypothetical protein
MLTSTYTLVALSIEQTTARAALQSLLDELHALPGDFATLAAGRAARLCGTLRQVYDDCHWRKLDKFVVPALRRATDAVTGLLRDCEMLSGEAAEAMAAAEACVGEEVDAGTGSTTHSVPRGTFSAAVERCVAALRLRLEREEQELFPLARAAIGIDAWFAIANQMLAHDAHARERRAAGVAGGPRGMAPPAREMLQAEAGWRLAFSAMN